ncbi:MAG: glycosyltransferase family 4 protein [Prevotella sp.]|nr:glycosyltransferase family 4 protein [Prevotella sp.]
MKVLVVSFYYPPEIGAAASRISNMVEGLQREGAEVEVLTCLPSYPKGRIFEGYRRRLWKNETINGIKVYRFWTYASVSKNPFSRVMGMFMFAILLWTFGLRIMKVRSYDRVVVQSPPLPVAFSSILLFRFIYRRPTVLNVSDLWPTTAVVLGAMKKDSLYYRVLAAMERFVYRHTTVYQGQSQEIINHVEAFGFGKRHFLYRNLQPAIDGVGASGVTADRSCLRLVYAGLLGVAQDILGMIEHIDFKQMGVELHIFGDGNQSAVIDSYVKTHDCGVVFHGYKPKGEISRLLSSYHASIVPLAVAIKGAVPSKIFDLLPHGTPVLFCGGGEGERIVAADRLGLVSPPGDYDALRANILALKSISDAEYEGYRTRCKEASKHEFSFDEQMKKYYQFLKNYQQES